MPVSKRLLIVFHSQSGSTSRMADAVIHGAKSPEIEGVQTIVRSALEATAEEEAFFNKAADHPLSAHMVQ